MVDAKAMARCECKLEISELERFLQTWLFFGLLQETLGEIFHRRDFVDITRSKAVISTKKLPARLKQWMSDPTLDDELLTHLYRCLHMTFLALLAAPRTIDSSLKIGIAATAEILGTALILAGRARDISTELFSTSGYWGDFDE